MAFPCLYLFHGVELLFLVYSWFPECSAHFFSCIFSFLFLLLFQLFFIIACSSTSQIVMLCKSLFYIFCLYATIVVFNTLNIFDLRSQLSLINFCPTRNTFPTIARALSIWFLTYSPFYYYLLVNVPNSWNFLLPFLCLLSVRIFFSFSCFSHLHDFSFSNSVVTFFHKVFPKYLYYIS